MKTVAQLVILCLALSSCNQEHLYQHITTDEFILEDGFQIELVAAEPLLNSPMALDFDDQGRIWVAEMPGYMRDIDGSDEYAPDGRIVILEDTNNDGLMDQRTIFLDSLVLPRALKLLHGGLLFVETPKLFWVPIENGLKPGKRQLVDSLYVRGGNIEHQPNGLLYHLNNWLYSAKGDHRYRRMDGQWIKEATTFRGQWGITQDDAGRLFYNDNSSTLLGDHVPPNTLTRHPYLRVEASLQQTICPDTRVYPFQATAVNRGYQPGVLDSLSQKLLHFTSACSPWIYRADQFPDTYYGNAFVCGPEANLIKRVILEENTGIVTARQAYDNKEFLLSKNETFRPINLYTGPDGALYVVDLRKGVIQHRAYMTRYLRDKILNRGLEQVNGWGRIYRISAVDGPQEPLALLKQPLKPQEWMDLLDSPNSWQRMRAQRWLIDHPSAFDPLLVVDKALESEGQGAVHALWVLEGRQTLDDWTLHRLAETANPLVREQLLWLADRLAAKDLAPLLAIPPDSTTHLLARAYGAGVYFRKTGHLNETYVPTGGNQSEVEAFVAGLNGAEQAFLAKATPSRKEVWEVLQKAITNRNTGRVQAPQVKNTPVVDNRDRAARLYALHCGSCHGSDGKGLANLAPPLYQSEYIAGDPRKMILISLQGIQGPITVEGVEYDFNAPMPGYKDNTQLTDQDLADLMSFIRNGFGADPEPVDPNLVKDMRALVANRKMPFTATEILQMNFDNL